ncbi:MAG TPA: T9SS type A sorting domain-containing protein [Balneolales bacterium]|nr:T9SS type A sorting domain-containing protein [Balneolales bacterium]
MAETRSIPRKFVLRQNYPNPFNPTTNIQYSLPVSGHVSLGVYNILGQSIANLVDKDQPAGSYTIRFDAHNLPCGVYIYRLVAGRHTMVKKMMVIK